MSPELDREIKEASIEAYKTTGVSNAHCMSLSGYREAFRRGARWAFRFRLRQIKKDLLEVMCLGPASELQDRVDEFMEKHFGESSTDAQP